MNNFVENSLVFFSGVAFGLMISKKLVEIDAKSYYGKYNNDCLYEDTVFKTRGDAEEVLAQMDEIIETYGVVSVSDYLCIIGETSAFTSKYGWTNLDEVTIIRAKNGWRIMFPDPVKF